MFSGSYLLDDVTFLLKPVRLEPTDVVEKERLIQSGRRHYSEMISREQLPSPAYLSIFHQALAREKARFARDVLTLARHIDAHRLGNVTLVSLARAGTPIGALLGRTLRRVLGRSTRHYSVSIIRDRGIDQNALRHVLQYHAAASIVFVDGWTGKGVIADELRAVEGFNRRQGMSRLDPGLYVVADLCGAATFAATTEDYLIPSSVLGATISGLVSRSILNDDVVGPGDFHGCLHYEDFAEADLSRWFVDQVFTEIERQAQAEPASCPSVTAAQNESRRRRSDAFVENLRRRFGLVSVHHIKPGIGEATRVLLRRVPECVLVRDDAAGDVAHLMLLAQEKRAPIIVDRSLPIAAAAIIKEFDG